MEGEDTMTTHGAAPRLRKETEGAIGIGIAKDTDRPAMTVAVEAGVDALEAVLGVEASGENGHRTMEVRQAEK